MTTANFMGLSLYQQMIYYTHMMLMTRNKFGYKDIFKSGILSHLSNTLNSEHFAERDAKAIFFTPCHYQQAMLNLPQQTNKKPAKVYKRDDNEEMKSYPESYYKEIVKFVNDSRNWAC